MEAKRMRSIVIKFALILVMLIAISYFGSIEVMKEPFPERSAEMPVVAVMFNGSKEDGGWNEAQYRGFESIQEDLKIRMIYREYVNDRNDDAVDVVDHLVNQEKAQIIFATSYDYGPAIQKAAKLHPDVKFFHLAGAATGPNLDTYFGRMYQARYLTGIVAGKQTQTNQIGFVAAFPIPEVIRGINAFTLGVRSVNPQAVVHVKWSGTWNDSSLETAAANALLDAYPIDVLTQHQNTTFPLQAAQQRGVKVIGYNMDHQADFPDVFLTAPVWQWGPFYRERLQECFEGRFKEMAYFEGYQKYVFGIAPLSPIVDETTKQLVEQAERRILSGRWDVFYGPVYDQQGRLRIQQGENISDQELIESFDWFVEGVEGSVGSAASMK